MSYRYGKKKVDGFIKQIRHKEILLSFAKSSGPGGQKINKIETKVQLSWDIHQSAILPQPFLQRCIERNSKYITDEGILRIDTSVHRTQKANKEQTYKKFVKIVKFAFAEKAVRKKTKPPKRAVYKRIAEKKRKSKRRNLRKRIVG